MSITKQLRNQEQLERTFKMMELQDKERTSTMLIFDSRQFSLYILEERNGYMTVSIRRHNTTSAELVVRFSKDHNKGVIYTFLSPSRLLELGIEENKLNALIDAVARRHRLHGPKSTFDWSTLKAAS